MLRAFSDYQASRHRVPQATSLPDPSVSFTQFARSIETRVGSQQRMVGISQTIPGLGKRTAGGQLASKVADISDRLYDGVRSDVVLRVKQAYYDLGFLDRALAENRLYEELLDHFEAIARRRYAEGVGLQRDGLRLQAEITRTLQQRHQLRSQRVRLEAILNALRDAPADTPVAEVRLAAPPGAGAGSAVAACDRPSGAPGDQSCVPGASRRPRKCCIWRGSATVRTSMWA